MNDQLSFLVNETLNQIDNQDFEKTDLEDFRFGETEDNKSLSEKEDLTLPKAPGLLYVLEKREFTFLIKGVNVTNLSIAYEEILEGKTTNPEIEKVFLKNQDFDFKNLKFFQVEYPELAEVIKDQVFNRRMPLSEQGLVNISDPSLSWWMSYSINQIDLYFCTTPRKFLEHSVKLGPLADQNVAHARFKEMVSLFKSLFTVADFYCDKKMFSLKTVNSMNDKFESFMHLLLNGASVDEFFPYSEQKKQITNYLFLKEISAVRKFWILIESELKRHSKTQLGQIGPYR